MNQQNKMATLTKEESEQMAELLGKLGIQEPAGIETLTDLTKILPKVKKEKKEINKERLSFGADNIEDDDEDDEKSKGKDHCSTKINMVLWSDTNTKRPCII